MFTSEDERKLFEKRIDRKINPIIQEVGGVNEFLKLVRETLQGRGGDLTAPQFIISLLDICDSAMGENSRHRNLQRLGIVTPILKRDRIWICNHSGFSSDKTDAKHYNFVAILDEDMDARVVNVAAGMSMDFPALIKNKAIFHERKGNLSILLPDDWLIRTFGDNSESTRAHANSELGTLQAGWNDDYWSTEVVDHICGMDWNTITRLVQKYL